MVEKFKISNQNLKEEKDKMEIEFEKSLKLKDDLINNLTQKLKE